MATAILRCDLNQDSSDRYGEKLFDTGYIVNWTFEIHVFTGLNNQKLTISYGSI